MQFKDNSWSYGLSREQQKAPSTPGVCLNPINDTVLLCAAEYSECLRQIERWNFLVGLITKLLGPLEGAIS